MEHHPRINTSDTLIKESKIILGSFPTWSITNPDSDQKNSERKKNGDLPFYYGSSANRFWLWYQKYVDPQVSKENVESIQKSLEKRSIGITDMIISC